MNSRLHRARNKSDVASIRSGVLQRKCACGQHTVAGGECAECRKKCHRLQRRAVNQSGPAVAPPIVHEVLRSPGRPLAPTTRAYMEPRLGHALQNRSISKVTSTIAKSGLQVGAASDPLEREAEKTANTIVHTPISQGMHHDLSHVRIHTGHKAAQSAKAVNARAYTVGQNIVFGAGQYQPVTLSGQRLLAHEITHVRQQSSGQSAQLQRHTLENDPATAPPMSCEVTSSSPNGVSLDIMFDINSAELSPLSKAAVSNFVRNWHQLPVEEEVQVHGFASIDGPPTTNWPLSCDRAEILANELMTPSDGSQGIPARHIRIIAHGETNQFSSSLAPNRRAQAIVPALPPPAPPEPRPTPEPSFRRLPGHQFRVDMPSSPAWVSVQPTYLINPRGEPWEFPHYLKVRVEDSVHRSGGKWNVVALEGKYKGMDADIDPKHLNGTAAYQNAGELKFNKTTEQLWYGSKGPIEAFTQDTNPVPDGEHDIEIPDFHHKLGASYGDYATTWFRIGHSGDRYLHPGRVSLGCSTVKDTAKWPEIWRYLIRRRKGDDKSVGVIKVSS